MPPGYYKDVCEQLATAGFGYVKNAKGSHEKWMNSKSGKIVIVPVKLLSKHTANGILKDAGVGKKF